jgi:hypothetical protein
VEAAVAADLRLIVVAGGAAAADARLPGSVLVLPDGLANEAAAFERAFKEAT